jgi:hypothetical protein
LLLSLECRERCVEQLRMSLYRRPSFTQHLVQASEGSHKQSAVSSQVARPLSYGVPGICTYREWFQSGRDGLDGKKYIHKFPQLFVNEFQVKPRLLSMMLSATV